jgi:hypothetical protein
VVPLVFREFFFKKNKSLLIPIKVPLKHVCLTNGRLTTLDVELMVVDWFKEMLIFDDFVELNGASTNHAWLSMRCSSSRAPS